MFANGCFVTDANHRFDDPDRPSRGRASPTKGPTRIGDNVWCGANVVITSGVTVGDRCVIGANSVVTRDLPPFSIAAGAPRAQAVGPRRRASGAGAVTARYLLTIVCTPSTTPPANSSERDARRAPRTASRWRARRRRGARLARARWPRITSENSSAIPTPAANETQTTCQMPAVDGEDGHQPSAVSVRPATSARAERPRARRAAGRPRRRSGRARRCRAAPRRVGEPADRRGAGSVSTQAATMLPATPQRTAETRLAAPVPMIAPEMTCVVESGKPTCEAARITVAPTPCAAKPWAGSILMIRLPIVRMIRQPPT